MKFSDINKKIKGFTVASKYVYETFSNNESLNSIEVSNTPWHGKTSEKSFCIGKIDKDLNTKTKFTKEDIQKLKQEKSKILKKHFNIQEKCFDEKFEQATSGSGQEYLRITVMHSSSLCGLLHFYNLEGKTITVNINNNIKSFEVEEVRFEEKNDVIVKNYPSNMDVVLKGKMDGELTILFLELKFSEYLSFGSCRIGKSYTDESKNKGTFKHLVAKRFIDENNLTNDGYLVSYKEKTYNNGLKQMISHYIGVCNYIEQKNLENRKVYLGSMIFKHNFKINKKINNKECWKIYESSFSDVMGALEDCPGKPSNLVLIKNLLYYQNVFNENNLKKEIFDYYKPFYQLEKN